MRDDFRGISPSQLDAMSCRLAWFLGYRLGYRTVRLNAALDLGTGIHAGLEEFYKDKSVDPASVFQRWCRDRRKEIDPKWEDDLNQLAALEAMGMSMLEGYIAHYGDDPNIEVLATEHTLTKQIPIPDSGDDSGFTLTARLDGIIRDLNTGKLFSFEHKTYSRLSTKHFDLDHQFTAQVWLGQDLASSLGIDEPILGVLYNGLRKMSPGPRVKDALFHREKIFRNETQIDAMLIRAYYQCIEFSGDDVAIYAQPNPIRCQSCNFREVCIAWQRGEDYQFILNESFVTRKDSPSSIKK